MTVCMCVLTEASLLWALFSLGHEDAMRLFRQDSLIQYARFPHSLFALASLSLARSLPHSRPVSSPFSAFVSAYHDLPQSLHDSCSNHYCFRLSQTIACFNTVFYKLHEVNYLFEWIDRASILSMPPHHFACWPMVKYSFTDLSVWLVITLWPVPEFLRACCPSDPGALELHRLRELQWLRSHLWPSRP